jgi:hypothetical protein
VAHKKEAQIQQSAGRRIHNLEHIKFNWETFKNEKLPHLTGRRKQKEHNLNNLKVGEENNGH